MGQETRIGREYLRASVDRSGRERSPDEQHHDNEAACAAFGIELADPFRDIGSASRYASKERSDFPRLLADLESGRFGASVLVLWESSRGSRRVGEWVTLIELCEEKAVTIFVTTHNREYDPANPRDRRTLLEDAVDSEYESSKTSARARRAAAANAAEGKPHGRVPFGYRRLYDERTRRLVAQEPHPEEAPIVRELFRRLKAGHSIRSIVRDFDARGIRNDKGNPFTGPHLRDTALKPLYAGLRVYQGGRKAAPRLGAPGMQQVEATWPGLVSVEDFLSVQQILNDPARVTTRPGKARHLVSMIARCDVCGDVLCVTTRPQKGMPPSAQYQCRGAGHVRCSKDELETEAQKAILAYLARTDVHDDMTAGEGDATDELQAVRDQLGLAEEELKELRAAVSAGELSVASLIAAEPGIIRRVNTLREREKELATPSKLRGLIEPGEDVAERWIDVPIEARREIARIVLVPELVGELRVARRTGPKGQHQPVKDRIRWRRDD